jgi:hypothetical protein
MRKRVPTLAALSLAALASSALAHPGHVGEQAGHSHVLALGAIALAIVVVVAPIVAGIKIRGRRMPLRD